MNNIVIIEHDFGFSLDKIFFFFEGKKEAKLYKFKDEWFITFKSDCFVQLNFKKINNIFHFEQRFGNTDMMGYIWKKNDQTMIYCNINNNILLSEDTDDDIVLKLHDLEFNKIKSNFIFILNKKKLYINYKFDMYEAIIISSLIFLYQILI